MSRIEEPERRAEVAIILAPALARTSPERAVSLLEVAWNSTSEESRRVHSYAIDNAISSLPADCWKLGLPLAKKLGEHSNSVELLLANAYGVGSVQLCKIGNYLQASHFRGFLREAWCQEQLSMAQLSELMQQVEALPVKEDLPWMLQDCLRRCSHGLVNATAELFRKETLRRFVDEDHSGFVSKCFGTSGLSAQDYLLGYDYLRFFLKFDPEWTSYLDYFDLLSQSGSALEFARIPGAEHLMGAYLERSLEIEDLRKPFFDLIGAHFRLALNQKIPPGSVGSLLDTFTSASAEQRRLYREAFVGLVQWHSLAGSVSVHEDYVRRAIISSDGPYDAGWLARQVAKFNKMIARRFFEYALQLADECDAASRACVRVDVAMDSRVAGIGLTLPSLLQCFREFSEATVDIEEEHTNVHWIVLEKLIGYSPLMALKVYDQLRCEWQRHAFFSAIHEVLVGRTVKDGAWFSTVSIHQLIERAQKRPRGYDRARSLAVCARLQATV